MRKFGVQMVFVACFLHLVVFSMLLDIASANCDRRCSKYRANDSLYAKCCIYFVGYRSKKQANVTPGHGDDGFNNGGISAFNNGSPSEFNNGGLSAFNNGGLGAFSNGGLSAFNNGGLGAFNNGDLEAFSNDGGKDADAARVVEDYMRLYAADNLLDRLQRALAALDIGQGAAARRPRTDMDDVAVASRLKAFLASGRKKTA